MVAAVASYRYAASAAIACKSVVLLMCISSVLIIINAAIAEMAAQ